MARSLATPRARRTVALFAAVALVASLAGSAVAAPGGKGKAGFRTSIQAMLKPGAQAPAGLVIDPILTVGDEVEGFLFDSIPDGISLIRHGRGTVDLFVNHETSLVPFPGILTDYTNSHVDRLRLNQSSAGVLEGVDVIPSSANYQRFCSNFLAGAEQGFARQLLFTNEEATDVVNRQGLAWPVPNPDGSQPEQAGVVVALDIESGEYRSLYGMGRHNHENSVAIPGYSELVVLSGDDTFTAPASQLYSYIAPDTDAVWNDEGALYAFQSSDPLTNDYGDLTGTETVSGTFIPVPREVAVADQTALENWSNANNVFQFIRVEDIAYDRTDPNVVYFADTGEPRADPTNSAGAGRLARGGSAFRGPYMNGRIFKMVLNAANPRQVDSLSILIDADLGGYNNPLPLHQPDNVETTANSLLIQEDPGGHNQFALSDPAGVGARVWRYDLIDGSLEAVIEVDQSLDNRAGYDEGPALANRGGWESSGIIDASSIWGPGWFLVDVQAGTLILETDPGMLGDRAVVFEREGGQLLRVNIPGA
jgi:hypothetical protein